MIGATAAERHHEYVPPEAATGAWPTVLIVDDSACFRQAARQLLSRRGYAIVGEADCVSAALNAALCLAPQAVLLDTQLPDGSGFEVAAMLSVIEPTPAVLLVSAAEFPWAHALAEANGARGFVLKSELGMCDLGLFWPHA
jgi:DNA-binding NarL/FixJ family response regulator